MSEADNCLCVDIGLIIYWGWNKILSGWEVESRVRGKRLGGEVVGVDAGEGDVELVQIKEFNIIFPELNLD